jgi:hypothetical protein
MRRKTTWFRPLESMAIVGVLSPDFEEIRSGDDHLVVRATDGDALRKRPFHRDLTSFGPGVVNRGRNARTGPT